MINNSCPQWVISSQDVLGFKSVFSASAKQQSSPWVIFDTQTFELGLRVDDVLETCKELLSKRQFASAITFMLEEIYEQSKTLSNVFDVGIGDETEIPILIEKLKSDERITEEEWSRLTILQMALDGIDMEVHEGYGEIDLEALDYLSEFLTIIGHIMARNNVYVGVSMSAAFWYETFTYHGSVQQLAEEMVATVTTMANPSSFCILNFPYVANTNATEVVIASLTNQ